MEKYLSLEEAAEVLGVEYKTVYRLVRSGELPAGKIGRVYRIKGTDLDGYFERSKALARGVSCAVCGRRIISVLGIGTRCEVCEAPICARCMGTRDTRRCPKHEGSDQADKEENDEN